ncbi:MAG: Ig-like domain-containing protein [Bacteroidetes bacterium]|nr:Ig-like domain-containing protein [Bacteroidota bacterium]
MKNLSLLPIAIFLSLACTCRAQDPECKCPPIKMYIYDTRLDFKPDSPYTAEEAGKYTEAQNSGDWLDAAYTKQQSDEFKVYKNFAPGAKTGSSVQYPPSNGIGPSDIDFTSSVNISREGVPGKYTYDVTLVIFDSRRAEGVVDITQAALDLGDVDATIDALVGSLGPIVDKLRDYQKQIRDGSNGTKWIGAKWRTTADKHVLKIQDATDVNIKLFDCADEKPIANQQVSVKLTNTDKGDLGQDKVTTNSSGEAVVTFTARKTGSTRVYVDYTYTDIYDRSGNATKCNDQGDIDIVDDMYKVTMEAEVTGPSGMHYKLKGEATTSLISFADSTYGLRSTDGTKNMQVNVITAGVPGKMTLINPRKYNIPIVINVGNVGAGLKRSAKATIAIQSFSPTDNMSRTIEEMYRTPASVISMPNNINAVFHSAFMQNTISSVKANGAKARQDLPVLERLRANKNNPAYFQSAQGKADLAALQKLSQQHGFDLSKMYSGKGKAPAGASAANIAFVQGIKNTQTDPNASKTAPDAGVPSVMGGLYQKEGTFNPQSSTALEIDDQSSVGPVHGNIKITIEKIK